MSGMTPQEIVHELDKHIVGQERAKRAVAIALRNRWRRQQVAEPLRQEITPKNILMIGPTGVGKTEIARRLARLADAPFIKIEATKFTEVGYVGRDVDSIVRDLVEIAVKGAREQAMRRVRTRAQDAAEERILDALLPSPRGMDAEETATRQKFRKKLREGELGEREIEIEVAAGPAQMEILAPPGMEELTQQIQGMFQNLGGARRRTRKMKIREALAALTDEEAAKLVSDEDLKSRALANVEANYRSILSDPDIWLAMQVTGRFVFWSILLEVVLGFALALALDKRFRGHGGWTTIILLPMMLSPAVVGTFWTFLFQPQIGLFNYLVAYLAGIPRGSFQMIGDVALAPWAIVIVDVWMWTPYVMLICLAGLRSIPDYLYEAAEVDRASAWRQFWSITVPMVLPFLMLAVLFRAIENFKMFDMVNLLTSGGPGSTTELVSITLKRAAFEKWRTGYSSALAIILFVTVFGAANIYVKLLNRVKQR